MIENTNINVASLAKYKAISLLGRSAIDKLKDNGLVVMNVSDLEKLQADLHALSAQVGVVSRSYNQAQALKIKPGESK